MINWTDVHYSNFEKFVYYIIGKNKFHNREWFGKGGSDKGRDVVAYTHEELPLNLAYKRKWIFQCKKWARFPINSIIINEIATASQHNPDFWVLVIPLNPTTDQIDFLKHLNENYSFKILLFPLVAIEELIQAHPESIDILLDGVLKIDDKEGVLNV